MTPRRRDDSDVPAAAADAADATPGPTAEPTAEAEA